MNCPVRGGRYLKPGGRFHGSRGAHCKVSTLTEGFSRARVGGSASSPSYNCSIRTECFVFCALPWESTSVDACNSQVGEQTEYAPAGTLSPDPETITMQIYRKSPPHEKPRNDRQRRSSCPK